MRILVLTNLYPPHHYGGYELSCRDVMVRLADEGEEVRVLTSDVRIEGVDDGPGEPAGSVHRELELYWDDHVLVSPPLPERWRMERRNQKRLRHHLDEFAPDVVSAWNMGAMSLGLLSAVLERGRPALLAVCDDWLCYGPRLDAWTRAMDRVGPLGRPLARAVGAPVAPPHLGLATTCCFVSDFTRERAIKESRWSIADSTVVFSGIERDEFAGVSRSPDQPFRHRLLYVGRLDDRKGIFTLLDALHHLPSQTTLELLGRGDPRVEQRLKDRITEEGWHDRVHLGVVDRSQLSGRYAAADVFVFPSEWDEPFGLTPVEAMACGVPVAGTGTGGSGEFLVDAWNCVRFPPGDAPALAAAVQRLAEDPTLRRRVVANGRATAAQLDTDALAATFLDWHQAVASRFADGRPDARHLDVGPG